MVVTPNIDCIFSIYWYYGIWPQLPLPHIYLEIYFFCNFSCYLPTNRQIVLKYWKTWFNELHIHTKESGYPGELICMKAGTTNFEIKPEGILSLKILSNQRFMVRKINLYEETHIVKQHKNIGRKTDTIKKVFVPQISNFIYFKWNTLTWSSFIIFTQKHLKRIYPGKLWNQHLSKQTWDIIKKYVQINWNLF